MSVFEPARFRREGHALVDRLASHLEESLARRGPVLPAIAPDEALAAFPANFGDEPTTTIESLVDRVIAASNHLHHPRYVGHQVAAPLPELALLELTAAFLNNGMAVYEMGPASSAMERNVVRFLGEKLGFSASDGVLTSGGTLGNLTALLAAREALAGRGAGVVVASSAAHYSVARAAKILGLRKPLLVPVDEHFRMRPDALAEAISSVKAGGRQVVAVVASACSTATGAFDPLVPIAEICERERCWLHVDGAHGASFVLSSHADELLRGVERADSVTWDAHKMLLLPALVTAVIFRDGRRSFETFAQRAAYLFADEDPRSRWFDFGQRTFECTKRMMSLELYGLFALRGLRPIRGYLDSRVALTRRSAERLRSETDFEVPVLPACNILCFRHLRAGEDPNERQGRVRRAILESGRFYLVETKLRGRAYLRVTIVNPETNDDDLDALVEAIRAL